MQTFHNDNNHPNQVVMTCYNPGFYIFRIQLPASYGGGELHVNNQPPFFDVYRYDGADPQTDQIKTLWLSAGDIVYVHTYTDPSPGINVSMGRAAQDELT